MRLLFYIKHTIHLLLRPWIIFRTPLLESAVAPDPMAQFARWYRWARRCFWQEFPEAMCLGTVSDNAVAESRYVLLKDFDQDGFVFYTNYQSAKGQAIGSNPDVALLFYWDALGWQVRVQGRAERVSAEESNRYFATRPRTSQIGAWSSNQSEVVATRLELEKRRQELEQRFAGAPVPRPEHWGGYRVSPHSVEFWQLGAGRMHDRLRYRRDADGRWIVERLSP